MMKSSLDHIPPKKQRELTRVLEIWPDAGEHIAGAEFYMGRGNTKLAAFNLHQSLEQAYSCVLLTLTNYGPPSHNLKFLRSLAEEQDRRLAEAFPRDQRSTSRLVQHPQ